jgi:hypothetical protein
VGLKNDFQEAKELWASSSWPTKLLVGIWVFFAVSSVTSLADEVFKWKGFILDGLVFYRAWISVPLAAFASRIGLRYSQFDTDILLLHGLFFGSICRVLWILIRHSEVRLPIYCTFAFLGVMFVSLSLFLGLTELSEASAPWPGRAFIPAMFVLLYVWLMMVLLPIRRERGAMHFIRRLTLAYLGLPAVAAVIVLVLGAVNAGISRTEGERMSGQRSDSGALPVHREGKVQADVRNKESASQFSNPPLAALGVRRDKAALSSG